MREAKTATKRGEEALIHAFNVMKPPPLCGKSLR
ncbi:hypothetical protein AGROH133_09189 [Agrobacterium tumefaciens]|nr:hypothetical protein AGROH133_09189 [Agrobacterium tumefaciens]